MREFDALKGYPAPKTPRLVGPRLRTIQQRIIATYRDRALYDGDRSTGYGGFNYDGRWLPIARSMCLEYGLSDQHSPPSSLLQINCEKGFLLHDFRQLHPGMKIRGTEISDYAIENAMPSVRSDIQKAPFTNQPFADQEFDFVIAIGAVYSLSLTDAIQCLKEIQRVGRGQSFITLASYETDEDLKLFRYWSLLGTTVLKKAEWLEVLKHVGYTGDFKFTNAQNLNLQEDKR